MARARHQRKRCSASSPGCGGAVRAGSLAEGEATSPAATGATGPATASAEFVPEATEVAVLSSGRRGRRPSRCCGPAAEQAASSPCAIRHLQDMRARTQELLARFAAATAAASELGRGVSSSCTEAAARASGGTSVAIAAAPPLCSPPSSPRRPPSPPTTGSPHLWLAEQRRRAEHLLGRLQQAAKASTATGEFAAAGHDVGVPGGLEARHHAVPPPWLLRENISADTFLQHASKEAARRPLKARAARLEVEDSMWSQAPLSRQVLWDT